MVQGAVAKGGVYAVRVVVKVIGTDAKFFGELGDRPADLKQPDGPGLEIGCVAFARLRIHRHGFYVGWSL